MILSRARGFTFLEVIVTLSVMGAMMAGGAYAVARFGSSGRLSQEANRLADQVWELRAQATMGQQLPCMEFSADSTVRVYNDLYDPVKTNGYTAGTDPVKLEYKYKGRIKVVSIQGGGSPNHYLCFDSRGVKTGTSILKLTLRSPSGDSVRFQVNPATGMPKVVK